MKNIAIWENSTPTNSHIHMVCLFIYTHKIENFNHNISKRISVLNISCLSFQHYCRHINSCVDNLIFEYISTRTQLYLQQIINYVHTFATTEKWNTFLLFRRWIIHHWTKTRLNEIVLRKCHKSIYRAGKSQNFHTLIWCRLCCTKLVRCTFTVVDWTVDFHVHCLTIHRNPLQSNDWKWHPEKNWTKQKLYSEITFR